MFRLLVFLVFCGIPIFVLSDSNGTDCIFEFQRFTTLGNSNDNIVDYTGQKISVLVEEKKTYHYLTGPLVLKETLDTSFTVYYIIQKFTDLEAVDVVLGFRDACFFQQNIFIKYLLPTAGQHNDFPSSAFECPTLPFTGKLYPARSSLDLIAPSLLENGNYYCEVTFTKDFRPVGGFITNFTVLRDEEN